MARNENAGLTTGSQSPQTASVTVPSANPLAPSPATRLDAYHGFRSTLLCATSITYSKRAQHLC